MNNRKLTTWLIYAGMMSSIFIYVVIAAMTQQQPPLHEAPTELPMQVIFLSLAGMSTVLSFIVPGILGRAARQQDHDATQSWLTRKIVAWALAESIAIYGLVLFFVTPDRDLTTMYLFAAWSAVVLAIHVPKDMPGE